MTSPPSGRPAGSPRYRSRGASIRSAEQTAAPGIHEIEVLGIATANGAAALGLEDEIGTVDVGKRADLVVLTADPLANRNTRAIRYVFSGW